MVAGAQGDTGQYLNMLRDTYLDTTNVEYTLTCTIIANEVWEPHLGAWPRAWVFALFT